MMTVENMVEIMVSPAWYGILVIVFYILAVILALVLSFLNCIEHGTAFKVMEILVVFFMTLSVIMSLGIVANKFKIPSGKFKIEATFTEDYPFLSVMKEYNVVEQHENIFVLEPKERTID